jgi:hypothetical protein
MTQRATEPEESALDTILNKQVVFTELTLLTDYLDICSNKRDDANRFFNRCDRDVHAVIKTRKKLNGHITSRRDIYDELSARFQRHKHQVSSVSQQQKEQILENDVFDYPSIEQALGTNISDDLEDALDSLCHALSGLDVSKIENFLHDCPRAVKRRHRELILMHLTWQNLPEHTKLKNELESTLGNDFVYKELAEIINHQSQHKKVIVTGDSCPLVSKINDVNQIIRQLLNQSRQLEVIRSADC